MAPTSVTLNKTTLSLVVGANETLTATVLPENADDKTVTFTSSEPTIATVTPKQGNIVGKAEGKTKITGTTANGLTVTCDVTVTSV
ncbi:Ig-like domain-containing protein [Lactococcus lactis]|uniref:Ig-like domain-containing protein n=1 Tax=Lactococcus lactis TaxID=1358 RepID=UPI00339054B9